MTSAILLNVTFLLAAATASTTQEPVYKPVGGVSMPVLVEDPKPRYTPEAMRQGVSGSVKLECVVETDGTVSDVRVVKSLHPGLDESAVTAVKQWRFKPGMKDGAPVRVLIDVEMSFTLGRGSNEPRLDSLDVFRPGPGVTHPVLLKEVKPDYTVTAKEAGLQGTVTIDCVVLPDGVVGDTRVTRSLDPELDGQAINALKQWRFKPGQRQGKPVPVRVSVEIDFALK